jgi:opacity protein-like surface antigen
MVTHKSVSRAASRSVFGIQKAALLASTTIAVVTTVSSPVLADCNFGGTIGPGGAQFQGFLAATSNAATSAVTSMNTGFQTQTSAFISSPTGTQTDQYASGVWGRAVGGRMDTASTSSGTVVRRAGDTFSTACSTQTRNDFTGVQGGFDVGRLNFGATEWNAHLGVTGGQFETQATSQQGSGITRSEVPFIGLYAALVGPTGFFLDGQVAEQFYRLNISEPSIGAQGVMEGKGIAITSSAGYNFPLGSYFIEPSVGVVYSKVHLDPLNVSPTVLGTPAGTVVVKLPAILNLDDIETLPGRAGVRVGTSFVAGGVSLTPFVAASVWHEFARNTTMNASFIPTFGSLTGAPGKLNLSSTRIGTFGQYSLGIGANVLNTGWLGYARFDYRNGENIEALSVNGGLRYQLAPAPQVAAAPASRMFTKAPAAAVPQQPWSGFYLGAFGGAAWADGVTATELAPGAGARTFFNGVGTQTNYGLGSNGIAGLTLGYNRPMGSLVAGWEAEGGYLRLAGSSPFAANTQTISSTTIGDWYALLAGRLGLSVGPTLIYGKAGAALIDTNDSVIDACVNAPPCSAPARTVAAAGGNRIGVTWAAGGGLEYAVGGNWSVKGEYLALGTDDSNVASGPGLVAGSAAPQTFNWRHGIPVVQTAKIGVNYTFGSPAAEEQRADRAEAKPRKARSSH